MQIVVQALVPVGSRWIVTLVTPEPASLAAALTVMVCRTYAPGSITDTAGAVLSTRRFATTAEFDALPATSTACARRSYRPSASAVVLSEQLYGAVVAVQPVVHVEVPAGAYCMRTAATPEPLSVAVPESVTVPRNGVPGSETETDPGATASDVAAALSGLSARLSRSTPPAPATTARTT